MTTAVITMATGNALGERQTSLSNKPRAGRQGGVLFPPTFSLVARLWPRGRAPEGRNGGRVTGRQPFLTWSCPDPPASAQLTQAKASPFLTQALLPSELLSCCSPPHPHPRASTPRHSSHTAACSLLLGRPGSLLPLALLTSPLPRPLPNSTPFSYTRPPAERIHYFSVMFSHGPEQCLPHSGGSKYPWRGDTPADEEA